MNDFDIMNNQAANPLIGRIDAMIAERSLLKHPFYLKWTAGELTRQSLAGYSREYYQLVRNVPLFMDPIIAHAPTGEVVAELVDNRREEADHIAPWKAFARALDVADDELDEYDGLAETQRAMAMLAEATSDFEGGACAMYAFEKEIPTISQIKLDGLQKFYGIRADAAETEYFRLHTEADVRHAAAWVALLAQTTNPRARLLEAADSSISALNLLLDGCDRMYCQV